jgi:hypothetical protein
MTAYIFQTIANKASAGRVPPNATWAARQWYRNAAKDVASVSAPRMMTDKENIKKQITVNDIGKMFMFFYDPKLKEVLPYYDKFPLVFPIEFKSDGFLGINLHYLPPMLRAKLMDALYNTINNNKSDDNTRLRLSYQLLSGASRFQYFKPCLKRYLWSHVQSGFLNVQLQYWDTALMLPTERFSGANKTTIWADSSKKV